MVKNYIELSPCLALYGMPAKIVVTVFRGAT